MNSRKHTRSVDTVCDQFKKCRIDEDTEIFMMTCNDIKNKINDIEKRIDKVLETLNILLDNIKPIDKYCSYIN